MSTIATLTPTETGANSLIDINANFAALNADKLETSTASSTYAPKASPTFTGTVVFPSPFTVGATSVTATGTELNYVAGVTSAIQTQLNAKAGLVSPAFTTPDIGVATATSVNKVAITAPASAATLTIANNKTFTANASITIAGTDAKVLTVSNSLTLAGTDSTVMTFPSTSASIARIDAAQSFTGVQTITNITLPTNGQVLLTVPTTDGHATGLTTSAFVSGYTSSAVGDLVYLDSSSKWQKCDANTLALYNGLLGIALAVAATDASLLVALPGSFVYATAFPTFTVGSPIYMSETAGAVTQTAPTTTDAATRVIGWGIHADKMYFNPSQDYTTHI